MTNLLSNISSKVFAAYLDTVVVEHSVHLVPVLLVAVVVLVAVELLAVEVTIKLNDSYKKSCSLEDSNNVPNV